LKIKLIKNKIYKMRKIIAFFSFCQLGDARMCLDRIAPTRKFLTVPGISQIQTKPLSNLNLSIHPMIVILIVMMMNKNEG